ncbi:hypothetical protein [Novosphingobium sp.]|uniref:hypothetical protein n=1 Tax=Novosphingobium sp. TaxID=1874826 RepID=UPI00262068B3|nr:hypothetical protein [Novosphingobium sp.]
MNKVHVLSLIAAFPFAILALNNPNADDFRAEVKSYLYQKAQFDDPAGDLTAADLKGVAGLMGDFAIEHGTDVTQTNYIIFSVFKVRFNPLITTYAHIENERCYVGFLKSIFVAC